MLASQSSGLPDIMGWVAVSNMSGSSTKSGEPMGSRSPSGRVVGLIAVSASGANREWSGFDVRRALELPETLFSMHLRQTPDGEKRVRFLGRGWGHGVGLCQNGAFGLARAGMNFEQILNFITTQPKVMLSQRQVAGAAVPEEEKKEAVLVYELLKEASKQFKGRTGEQRYLMERIEQEFKDSLETAANASKQGRLAVHRGPREEGKEEESPQV